MHYDAIVIGGSFAGLSAATQLARARRAVRVIDAGQPRNRFAAAAHGLFAQDGVPPLRLIEKARADVLAYPTATFQRGTVTAARTRPDGGFALTLADGSEHAAEKLVLAFGYTDELPGIPGLVERWGTRVLHCPYCHGFEFGGQRLGVLRVGPMSVHQALLISDWGPVTFFLNGQTDLSELELRRLAQREVVLEPAQVLAVTGEQPDAALDVQLAGGRAITLDALYLGAELRFNSQIAVDLGCELEQTPFGPIIKVDMMQQTTVAGVYAAGDIARFGGNAVMATASGVLAGAAAHQSLVFGPLPTV